MFGICINEYFGILPTYNFLCFLLIVILVYLEKNHSDKDYLIGFIIGLAILSKHTVGLPLMIPMVLICFKNIKKILKRILGIFVPCCIFLVYLICNHALFDFINLSFLGLFDFGSNNSNFGGKLFVYTLILIAIAIYIIVKHPKNKYNYYLLCGALFCFPLYDLNHYSLFFNCFLIMLLQYINIKNIMYFTN